MEDRLSVVEQSALSPELVEMYEEAKRYAEHSKSENTKIAYKSDWRQFTLFCGKHGLVVVPTEPQTLVMYISHMAARDKKVSTIERALVAISQHHQLKGYESPTKNAVVREVIKGLRRKHGTAQKQVAPVDVSRLKKMVDALPGNMIAVRDKCLLLIGFSAALRRSEIVGINIQDIQQVPEGLVLRLSKSKTDQEGAGRRLGIPFASNEKYCPVRSYKQWTKVAGINNGPVFRGIDRHGNVSSKRLTGRAVANIIKRTATLAGMDATMFSGHSLRAGLITSAAKANVPERVLMATSRHTSQTMLRKYVREANIFEDAAVNGLL